MKNKMRFLKTGNIPVIEGLEILFQQQYSAWKLLADNHNNLTQIIYKTIDIENYQIKVQYNPSRAVSTLAKVDKNSISERKCFLCIDNLPPEERGLLWNDEYILVYNPYPILSKHIVISYVKHSPQLIYNKFIFFLNAVFDFSGKMAVIYNGPECGASAPDHLHFQAFDSRYFELLDYILNAKKNCSSNYKIISKANCIISTLKNFGRNILIIEGIEKKEINYEFNRIYNILKTFYPPNIEEPLLNIAGIFNEGKLIIILFLRDKHRPSYFYLEEPDKISVSPAAIDFSGILVVPNKSHFDKITPFIAADIFKQTTMQSQRFEKLLELL